MFNVGERLLLFNVRDVNARANAPKLDGLLHPAKNDFAELSLYACDKYCNLVNLARS